MLADRDEDYREAVRAIRTARAAIDRLPDAEPVADADANLREAARLLKTWRSTWSS